MHKCIFCEPTRELIIESELAYAIYDGYPVSQGHLLVIPRRHEASYFNLSQKEKNELWELVEKAKKHLETLFHPDGFNVGFNLNEAAGQTIFHVHIHIIPRYTGDVEDPTGGIRNVIPGKGKY